MLPVFLSKPKTVQIHINTKETAELLLFSSDSIQRSWRRVVRKYCRLLQLIKELLEILNFRFEKVLNLLCRGLLRRMLDPKDFGDVGRATSVPCKDLENVSAES